MRVLIFHGYLLRGTGSNVYNANLAQALARLGHDVDLLCQDREAATLGWVDAVGRLGIGVGEGLAPHAGEVGGPGSPGSPGSGSITAWIPEIGGLLPVYVHDRYAGFEVKTFSDLSAAELDAYIEANVRAVRELVEARPPDAALANHLVMGPLILARAGLRFATKVHGSALSYTVRPDPRFLPHAREGMEATSAVLVGSGHTARSLWETVDVPGLEARTRLGPPGVDVEAFAPLPDGADPAGHLRRLADSIDLLPGLMPGGVGAGDADREDSFARDPAEAAGAIATLAGARGPRILFVGKTIVSKGVDLLLAAWPLVLARHPGARLLIGGFGAGRAGLEELWASIRSGDIEAARALAARGRGFEGGEEAPLPILASFLAEPPAGWLDAATTAPGEAVSFSGRLEHAEVASLVRAVDAMVVPSTFPEAFGMVAAEAASAGAMPICADHSGLAEVASELDRAVPAPARGISAFPVAAGAPVEIAERLIRWLSLGGEDRRAAEAALSATVARLWSWEGVATGVLDAAAGRLEGLPKVPEG